MTMTQREIDAAQDALDAEEAATRCKACGQPLPESKKTHVYAVRLWTGGGDKRWFYSLPVTQKEADREISSLIATGHEAVVLAVDGVETHKRLAEIARKRKKPAAAPKRGRAR